MIVIVMTDGETVLNLNSKLSGSTFRGKNSKSRNLQQSAGKRWDQQTLLVKYNLDPPVEATTSPKREF